MNLVRSNNQKRKVIMASPKIGSIKDGKKVSMMSISTLEDKATHQNTRGRDAQKCRNELVKRGVKV